MLGDPILLAEPDDGHAAAIMEMVRILRPQATPVRAADGLRALERLKGWKDTQERPTAVILGEALSQTGGLAVMNFLAQDPHFQAVPVVMFNDAEGEGPRPDTGAERWTLDILADAQDPYDRLVRDLRAVLPVTDPKA